MIRRLLLLTALFILGLAPRTEGKQGDKTICVLMERKWADDSFLRGLRRPFLLQDLPVEREGPKGHWRDAGMIRNSVRLAASSCVDGKLADSLQVVFVGAEDGKDSPNAVDYAVRLRIRGWSHLIICYLGRPGDPPPAEEIDPTGAGVDVAMCAPESLTTTSLVWTPLQVWWREKPSSTARSLEIHGWIVGMAALQTIHRRLGLLPDSLDLVFESRGRNR